MIIARVLGAVRTAATAWALLAVRLIERKRSKHGQVRACERVAPRAAGVGGRLVRAHHEQGAAAPLPALSALPVLSALSALLALSALPLLPATRPTCAGPYLRP